MKRITLRQKAHLLTVQNRQKALERGWFYSLILWNWKVGVVGYGFKFYMFLVGLLAGRTGFYLIFDLIGNKADMETTMEEDA